MYNNKVQVQDFQDTEIGLQMALMNMDARDGKISTEDAKQFSSLTSDLVGTLKTAKLPLSFVNNASTYTHLTTPETLAQLKYAFGIKDFKPINYADVTERVTGIKRVKSADVTKRNFVYDLQWYKNFESSFINVMANLMAMDYSEGRIPTSRFYYSPKYELQDIIDRLTKVGLPITVISDSLGFMEAYNRRSFDSTKEHKKEILPCTIFGKENLERIIEKIYGDIQ